MGIYLFVCGIIYLKANRTVGILGIFTLFYTVFMFTPDSYTFMLIGIFYLVLYGAVVIFYKEFAKNNRNWILNSLCIFSLINVLWMVFQYFGIYFVFYPRAGWDALETGWFSNRNEVSIYLALSIPLFFRKGWAWFIVLVLFGLLIAQCTNGFMVAVIVSGIYSAYRLCEKYPSKKAIVVVVALIAVVASVSGFMRFVHKGAYAERLAAFTAALELIKEKPLLGWGIGQSCYVIPLFLNGEKQTPELRKRTFRSIYYANDFVNVYNEKHRSSPLLNQFWRQLHNDYEQFAVDTGIVGLFLLLMVILAHIISFSRTKNRDVLIGLSALAILISANAFFTFQIGCFLMILVIFMGMIQGEYVSQRSAHR